MFLLKDCALIFAKPLTSIFTMSLSTLRFPIIWKEVIVCSIFKSGERKQAENYRPICILSNLVSEMVLYEMRMSSDIIIEGQQGFIKARSTMTNSTCMTQFITAAVDEASQVNVVYTDFSKAFDWLDNGFMPRKLSSLLTLFVFEVLYGLRIVLICSILWSTTGFSFGTPSVHHLFYDFQLIVS